ncbi:hypothetical protein HHK36_030525 [Tetracentron sinense]|uniref:Terpene synthase metal-binding domain-containing protein n=1 Tax=Tetracentron sinense TaxID=13715 RepID=A0A835CYC8_TETSI|nr:hypothetical protein HHK36_030525 [Tetracentron sinense]
MIDDIYDVYGSLDELKLFTDIVERPYTNPPSTPEVVFLPGLRHSPIYSTAPTYSHAAPLVSPGHVSNASTLPPVSPPTANIFTVAPPPIILPTVDPHPSTPTVQLPIVVVPTLKPTPVALIAVPFTSPAAPSCLDAPAAPSIDLGEIYVRKIEMLKEDVKRRFDEEMETLSLLELINTLQRIEGEDILDEAQEFTTTNLKDLKGNIAPHLIKQVSHALELPLHWTLPRIEARWFIDFYKMKEDMDPLLLEFAKLDFNMLQATYQQELKVLSRWWNGLGLGKTLNFTRDRLVECFLWSKGLFFEPQFGYCRKQITKVALFITMINDIYDVYGSLDEFKLFTDIVERWDINTLKDLPDYMKILFLALYNATNEMAYDILKARGWDIIPYLKKADELERGDVPKSIQCYMHESGVIEEIAREHIKHLIRDTLKKMNKDRVSSSPFPQPFISVAVNVAQTTQFMYQYRDGFSVLDRETKERVLSLLIEPISLLEG